MAELDRLDTAAAVMAEATAYFVQPEYGREGLVALESAGWVLLDDDETDALRWVLDRLDEEWASAGTPQRGSQRDVLRAALDRDAELLAHAPVTLSVRPGDVVALVAPDGRRRRYMASTLHGVGDARYELSDHVEGSAAYDKMLDERTTIVLRWLP